MAAVSQALTSLTEMRVVEGQELAAELNSRLDNIERQMPAIENEAARLPAVYREKLMKRLAGDRGRRDRWMKRGSRRKR